MSPLIGTLQQASPQRQKVNEWWEEAGGKGWKDKEVIVKDTEFFLRW